MRILVGHNFYQQAGGEDAVFHNEVELLRGSGHEVEEFLESNQQVGDLSLANLALRTIWSSTTHKKLESVLGRFRPDIVHFHNTFPLISPSVYYACSAAEVPVIQTLHNYRFVCPNALLYRDGALCKECLHKSVKWPAVVHACYRENRLASATVSAMLAVHRSWGTWSRKISSYIALSKFSRALFVESGLPAEKINVKPNFVSLETGVRQGVGEFALYVGRLSVEKGAEIMLHAWKRGDFRLPLRVIGDGPLRPELEAQREKLGLTQISFEGWKTRPEIFQLLKQARFLVFPSQCFENFPLVIAEAYACGVPVIASRLGAAAEIVLDGATGLLFEPSNCADLAAKIGWAMNHTCDMKKMGDLAHAEYVEKYTPQRNLELLMKIYEGVLERKSNLTGLTN